MREELNLDNVQTSAIQKRFRTISYFHLFERCVAVRKLTIQIKIYEQMNETTNPRN